MAFSTIIVIQSIIVSIAVPLISNVASSLKTLYAKLKENFIAKKILQHVLPNKYLMSLGKMKLMP